MGGLLDHRAITIYVYSLVGRPFSCTRILFGLPLWPAVQTTGEAAWTTQSNCQRDPWKLGCVVGAPDIGGGVIDLAPNKPGSNFLREWHIVKRQAIFFCLDLLQHTVRSVRIWTLRCLRLPIFGTGWVMRRFPNSYFCIRGDISPSCGSNLFLFSLASGASRALEESLNSAGIRIDLLW